MAMISALRSSLATDLPSSCVPSSYWVGCSPAKVSRKRFESQSSERHRSVHPHPRRDEIRFATAQMLYINPVACIDCGACVPACPAEAIFAEGDLPEQWEAYQKLNAEHYRKP